MVDIYRGHRGNFLACQYWLREEKASISSLEEWVLKNKPSGSFYAKYSNKQHQNNQLNNAILYDQNFITLETSDDVANISSGCLVMFNGKVWIVDSVSSVPDTRQSEFNQEAYSITSIQVRR